MITDVVMPHMNGRTLVERTTMLRPDMKTLLMSGYTDDAMVRHGVLAAEMAFVQKPFSGRALLTAVHELLQGSGD